MLSSILYPVLVLGGLGGALAVLLLVAARRFAVHEDPLVAAVEGALPGANCGGCGKAGCHAFAEALVATRDTRLYCPPGGSETAARAAELLGIEVSARDPQVAVVMCRGDHAASSTVGRYAGLPDCRAASLVDGGEKACSYGCLGLGSCVTACQFGAIRIENGIAVVDPGRCTACGLCIPACPRGIIRMAPTPTRVFVGCVSHDVGKTVRAVCTLGCIGCKRCVKACEYGAIQFDANLARVDDDRCTKCGACIAACPRNVIFDVGLSPEAHARAYPPKAATGTDGGEGA